MQDILYIIALSLGSILTLFILTKIMGYRQMSELSMFDYITGITIGSIAAEMATCLEDSFVPPLTAMITYGLVSTLLALLSNKSKGARRLLEGAPIILYNNDTLYEKNLKKAKLDIDELLEQCRISGYFDLSSVQTALLECNGKISFLPKSTDRPVNPNDLNMNPVQETLAANLIIDGKIRYQNLKHSGKDEKWLMKQLSAQGFHSAKEVLLATCDLENTFHAYGKNSDSSPEDVLS